MKLLLLLALHGAHASHKVTKNAIDAETTQSLAVEAATAKFIKMPGAVARGAGVLQWPSGLLPPQPPLRQHWIWCRLLLPLLYSGRTDWTGTGHFPGQAYAHCRDALVRGVPQVARLRSSRSAS